MTVKNLKLAFVAPQVILTLVDNSAELEKFVNKTIDDFAKRGFRALGVARTNPEGNWQFLGNNPYLTHRAAILNW